MQDYNARLHRHTDAICDDWMQPRSNVLGNAPESILSSLFFVFLTLVPPQ